ncbi:peptidoglycan editing factor PgeF [Zavarzinia compransoris]|uniref:peptidoglycan editing factor PgeF n=1 Tax=Zavarzinia marina TaxID=2911065 RepID=UPI001F27921B|nr:peptidoglycan editing factor PgeF [Zavarzinia marina]MCF4164860.1 peptidoglycan editing factor PgeF [Zavarzinia marina]
MSRPPCHLSPALGALPHGFFGRRGGVSGGIYDSLNCGFGSRDERQAVDENRARVAGAVGAGTLVSLHQIHSTRVATVETPWQPGQGPEADGMVTRARGIALGVLSADCAPILFADAEAGVIGAAHAGWKGAIGGVAEATVAAMIDLGAKPSRIAAAVGPCIGPASYEVGPEFEARFVEQDGPAARRFFHVPDAGTRAHFDLPAYVADRLARAGIGTVDVLGLDTAADEGQFFSYRRATHRGEADYGREVAAIMLD